MHPQKRHGTYDAIINRVCRRCFRIPVKTKESTVEKRSKIVIKVAVADRFQLKVVPSIKNFYMMGTREVHYIGGTEVLPAPLDIEEENSLIRPRHPVIGKVGEKVKDLRLRDRAQKVQVDVPNVDGLQIRINGHLTAHEFHKPQKHPQVQIVFMNRQRRLALDIFMVG